VDIYDERGSGGGEKEEKMFLNVRWAGMPFVLYVYLP
jgi:hypothetical protein